MDDAQVERHALLSRFFNPRVAELLNQQRAILGKD